MLQYNTVSCRPERRHISFPRIVGSTMSSVQTSHLLPTYARVDLAFERGEGAWLYTAEGERYLDFTSGVAVNVLGHAHPQLVTALTEQAQKVWHVSNLYRILKANGWRAGSARQALLTPSFSRIQARKRWSARLSSHASINPPPASLSATASSHSRVPFTAAR